MNNSIVFYSAFQCLTALVLIPLALGNVAYEYTLSPNGLISESISPAGDSDVYRIEVINSGTLTVYSSGTTDTYGYLLNDQGEQIISDDDGGNGYNFSISYSVNQGTYYVKIRHYSETETGNYDIDSSFTASANANTSGSINASGNVSYEYTLGPTGNKSESISPAGDEDIYQITVLRSGTLSITSSGTTDTYGSLLDSNGEELLSDDDGGNSYNFSISYTVNQGTYYVKIRHYSETETGDYVVSSTFVANADNNVTQTDTSETTVDYDYTLTPNDSRTEQIYPSGDSDIYRIDILESGTLTIYSTGSTDTYGCLLNNQGEEISSNDNGGEGSNFKFSYDVSEGTYYAKVRHYYGSVSSGGIGNYTIVCSYENDNNDDGSSGALLQNDFDTGGDAASIQIPSSSATLIRTSVGTGLVGTNTDEYDMYKLRLLSRQHLVCVKINNQSGDYLNLNLYDSTGTLLDSSNVGPRDNGYVWGMKKRNSRTCYVRVSAVNNNSFYQAYAIELFKASMYSVDPEIWYPIMGVSEIAEEVDLSPEVIPGVVIPPDVEVEEPIYDNIYPNITIPVSPAKVEQGEWHWLPLPESDDYTLDIDYNTLSNECISSYEKIIGNEMFKSEAMGDTTRTSAKFINKFTVNDEEIAAIGVQHESKEDNDIMTVTISGAIAIPDLFNVIGLEVGENFKMETPSDSNFQYTIVYSKNNIHLSIGGEITFEMETKRIPIMRFVVGFVPITIRGQGSGVFSVSGSGAVNITTNEQDNMVSVPYFTCGLNGSFAVNVEALAGITSFDNWPINLSVGVRGDCTLLDMGVGVSIPNGPQGFGPTGVVTFNAFDAELSLIAILGWAKFKYGLWDPEPIIQESIELFDTDKPETTDD